MKIGLKLLGLAVALFIASSAFGADADANRWTLQEDGSIVWSDFSEARVPHKDHIEASGEQVSTVLRYGVNEKGAYELERSIVWPLLRTIPNNTHASLTIRFGVDIPSLVKIDGEALSNEQVRSIRLNGFLTVESEYPLAKGGVVKTTRKTFPSTKGPFVCERVSFVNDSERDIEIEVPDYRNVTNTDANKGVNGSYTIVEKLTNTGKKVVKSGEQIVCDFSIQGYSEGKNESETTPDLSAEEEARAAFVAEMWNNLVVETPEENLNAMFAFAKIRACESIYRTKGGLMHGPGGESYYAAIWANDQAEYVNPFFPYLGYSIGNESALNSYMHFARFMNDEHKPIPSSIIAEGIDIWNGAGDRGDAAMIAYGAARYALVRSDHKEAETLWPLIVWCLDYCKYKLTDDGVVASRCDELEGRFPAGDANLCTSSLYYDALNSACWLGKELGVEQSQLDEYAKEAETLRDNIEKHFGANVGGYETYQYFDGCKKLRSWICIPFVMGIDERKEGTIDALFSKLWTKDGLLTEEGSKTFWDRSTLYALRGVFAVGATEQALEHLRYYSKTRLFGDHVPYAIEAWPEGSQRHLSAESGLYCRVYVEGLFGIRPTGFSSFNITPRLPKDWNKMAMRNIRGFGKTFDLVVEREDDGNIKTTLTTADGKIRSTVSAPDGSASSFTF